MRPILKKMMILVAAVLIISLCSFTKLLAQGSDQILRWIELNTRGTLKAVNSIPTLLPKITTATEDMDAVDESDFTKKNQDMFGKVAELLTKNLDAQQDTNFQKQVTRDMISGYGEDKDKKKDDNIKKYNDVDDINAIIYSTILDKPYQKASGKKLEAAKYEYLKNAAGLNIVHTIPEANWKGQGGNGGDDVNRYSAYYNAVMAIESFNAYVLKGQLNDGTQFNTLQKDLISKVTDSKWLSEIASQEMGVVLRQLLLFESQIYVLLTQLIQTQKQMVSAQAMTNTLLILNNQQNEIYLVSQATGSPQVS